MNTRIQKIKKYLEERYQRDKKVSFDAIEVKYINMAIEYSSEGLPIEDFRKKLKKEFNTYRANELPEVNNKIEKEETALLNLEAELKEMKINKKTAVETKRKAYTAKNLEDVGKAKSKIKELERLIQQKNRNILKLKLYLTSKTHLLPPINIRKWFFIFISIVYMLVASVLNIPVFTEAINGIPIAGIILAPLMGLVETIVAHTLGKAFALGHKRIGIITSLASAFMLSTIIWGQFAYTEHAALSALLIPILFILGATFSFIYYTSHFEREVENEENNRNQLYLKKNNAEIMLSNIEEKSKLDADKDVNNQISNLSTSITQTKKEISRLGANRNEKTAQIDALENKINSQVEIIFNLSQNI